MAYNIYKSDGSVVVIPDNIVDSQFYNPSANGAGKGVGTQLVGRNAIDYGGPVAQNFLQLTENFCSSGVPSDTTSLQGQTWFKKTSTTDGDLYVRIGAGTLLGSGIQNWRKVFLDDGTGGIPASSLLGGGTGTVVYQSATDTTAFLAAGSTNQVLISGSSPSWSHAPALSGANFTDIPNSALVNGGIPAQTGNSGKYLTTDGTNTAWATVSGGSTGIPPQTGNSGKFLTTNGTDVSWVVVPATLPTQTGNSGKYLTTDGTNASWAVVSGGGGGSGTVTSVALSGGTTGLTASGSPVTTSGTLTLAGTLNISNGGTSATTASAALSNLGGAPINAPTFTGRVTVSDSSCETTVTPGASDIDLTQGNYFTKYVNSNTTFTFSNAATTGNAQSFTLKIEHASGSITWPASVVWPASTAPTLTTGKHHLFFFVTHDGGAIYHASSLINYSL